MNKYFKMIAQSPDTYDKVRGYTSWMLRSCIEHEESWREWCEKIHPLRFDSDWDVYIIPPFGGALTRVVIKKNGKQVSMYFDAYSQLGYMYHEGKPIPYFEIYPSPDGEPRRYPPAKQSA